MVETPFLPPEHDISRRSFLSLTGAAALSLAASSTYVGCAAPGDSSKKIRMAVVGGGFGAEFYWHEHPNCVVTAVSDLRADRREKLKAKYKCDTAYDSLEEMLGTAKDVDGVAIFTEPPNHEKHVRLCLERGWHVFSACPACNTLEEAQRMVETKEKTGLRYMMAESSYYRQECILARNLFQAGEFGEMFYTEVEYYHDRGDLGALMSDKTNRFHLPDGSRSWRWGLPPMLYSTHSLGYLVGVTGERITRVSCLGWGNDHPVLKDNIYGNRFWNAASMMQTDRGHMCRCNVFWLCAAHGERAQWFGDKSGLYMTNLGFHPATGRKRPNDEFHPAKVPEYWKSDMLPPAMRHESQHGSSAPFLTAEFVNALLEDREPTVDVYEALAMTVPGIVARESADKGGEQLAVPQFERKPA